MFESWRAAGAAREQTDGVVAVLQRELLTPVDREVAKAHLEAMSLELAVSRASFAADDGRVRRLPRAVIGSALVAGSLTFMSGLGAAGALPAPAQHWLSGATRAFGIHLPDRPARPHAPSDDRGPAGSVVVPSGTETKPSVDRAPGTPATLHTGAESASSQAGTHVTASAVAGSHGTPSVAPTAPRESRGAEPDPTPADIPGSNAGGNGNSPAAVHANGAAKSGDEPTGHAGDNGNAAAAHANNGANDNQDGSPPGSTIPTGRSKIRSA